MAVSQGHQSDVPSCRDPCHPLLSLRGAYHRQLKSQDYSRAFQAMWNQPSVEHSGHTALGPDAHNWFSMASLVGC